MAKFNISPAVAARIAAKTKEVEAQVEGVKADYASADSELNPLEKAERGLASWQRKLSKRTKRIEGFEAEVKAASAKGADGTK